MNNNKPLQITVDVTEDGLLPVNVLAEASELSKAQVKEAMLKGAVWLTQQLPAIKIRPPKAKPVVVTEEAEEPDYYGVRARALETQALTSEGLSMADASDVPADSSSVESIGELEPSDSNKESDKSNNDEVEQAKPAAPRFSKPRRLRRIKSKLKSGDQLTLNYDEAVLAGTCPDATLVADEGSYSVWYKPAGMLCQGSRWGDHTTLNRWAEKHLEPERTAFIVHRIDRMAAGLVVLAHSKKTATHLANQFAARKVEKSYRVIVAGNMDLPLPHVIDSDIEGKSARTIITHKALLQDSPQALAGSDIVFSVLDINIETGRKHQIRRHLSSLGYPVLGDRLYGEWSNKQGEKQGSEQHSDLDLQLVAISIGFTAPDSGEHQHYYLPESLANDKY